jgi:zinc protease
MPTTASISAVFDSVAALHLPADSTLAVADGPLMATRPTPGRIVDEHRDAASGVITWTLSNGARVLFKPTSFDPDELLIHASGPGGWALLPDSLFYSPGRLVDKMMTEAAGVGTRDRTSLETALSTTGLTDFRVSITPTTQGITLGGSPKDLETLFQLLYLQFTAPNLDAAALEGWKNIGAAGLGFSFDDGLAQILARGNPRLIPPSGSLVPLADTGSALAVYRDRFGNAGDFTFGIVGATTAAQLRPLVERYIASLPSTGKKDQVPDLGIRPFNRLMRTTNRVLDVPKASTMLVYDGAFPTASDAYLMERRRLDALAWALRLEFTDVLREQMGGTYGVNVAATTYALPQEHFRFGINFDTDPARMNGMLDTMFLVLDTVRARGATRDELLKIAAMQRRAHEIALADNHYWLTAIELYDRLRIPFSRIISPVAATLTAGDIRAAAREYLSTDAYIHLTAMPKDSTLYTKVDSTGTLR